MDTPAELKFGTSGLRGLVSEMTDREVFVNTWGFLSFLEENHHGERTITLAGDLRSSTEKIMGAVFRAAKERGWHTLCAGKIPTPALACFTFQKEIAGVMVTGSHIPDDRNGIKFTKRTGEILKEDENEIIRQVKIARVSLTNSPRLAALFSESGMFKKSQPLPDFSSEKEASNIYVDRYRYFFPQRPLEGLKLVHYEHSAVGRDIVTETLKQLGATVISTGRSEKFIPVDTEKVSNSTRELFKKMAGDHSPFAVLSTDGDSDRPLLSDENGEIITGDMLGGMAALYLKPDFAALPVTTNNGVIRRLEQEKVDLRLTKIGSPYVIRAMEEQAEKGIHKRVAGWEANGGFLTATEWERKGNHLPSLPTRDALLPIVSTLLLARESGLSISKLCLTSFEKMYSHADIVDNKTPGMEQYTPANGRELIDHFSPSEKSVQVVCFDKGFPSLLREGVKTEPLTGKESLPFIQIKNKLSKYFSPSRGFGEISSINFVDGVRITFENSETVHLRPSGNAPEFRIYGYADTRKRAEEIVEQRLHTLPRMLSDLAAEIP